MKQPCIGWERVGVRVLLPIPFVVIFLFCHFGCFNQAAQTGDLKFLESGHETSVVPTGPVTIAQRFNVGYCVREMASPEETAETAETEMCDPRPAQFQPSIQDQGSANLFLTLGRTTNDLSCIIALASANDLSLPATDFLIRVRGETLFRTDIPAFQKLDGSFLTINGLGPSRTSTNRVVVLEQTSSSIWDYLSLDLTPFHASRAMHYERRIVLIKPRLLVVMDHVQASAPAEFRFTISNEPAWEIDSVWSDLRRDGATNGLTAHLLARPQSALAVWTVTNTVQRAPILQNGRAERLEEITALWVFLARPEHHTVALAFKLLESPDAIGARIHRDGLPTLVAFRKDRSALGASLAGLSFNGPIGVDIYQPKRRGK